MKLLFTGASACNADTLGRLFLLGSELCFLDRPSVTFGNWGTIGHDSNLRRFSTDGLPLKVSVFKPPSGPARDLYEPFIEADLSNPTFVKTVLNGLKSDEAFAEKLLPKAENYGGGLNGFDLRARLGADATLSETIYSLADESSAASMYDYESQEGRATLARTMMVVASIEVTSALLMADEIQALPVADDNTYPKLLALRSSQKNYVGGTSTLAPYLGLQFARSVIPDDVLRKIEFKDIFSYRAKTKDVYDAWSIELNQVAAKISEADVKNPADSVQKIIASELMPKVQKFENEMISVRDKLFGDLIKKVTVWDVPTISAAYLTDLSRIDAISMFEAGIKGAAIVAAGAKSIIGPVVDFRTARRAAKRNHAVSYIVGLTKR